MKEVKTQKRMNWIYETDEMDGVCIIAKDAMKIKFKFHSYSNEFHDVLKINQVIQEKLKEPVSVEGMADFLAVAFPELSITVSAELFRMDG